MSTTVRKADEAKIKDYKEDVDTLLVLVRISMHQWELVNRDNRQAGLLSAVTASFLVESYKSLQPDPNDLTNQLLAQILAQLAGNNPPRTTSFQSPIWAIRVNTLWIASLIFSIMTASLGILVKQWLKEFLAANDVATSPQAHLRIRFFRYPGLKSWKVFEFVAMLPMLLQLALGLFLLGLCFFTSSIHVSIRYTSLPLVSFWATIFLLVTLAPAFSPQCPYKTTFLKSTMRSLRTSLSKWKLLRSFYTHSTHGVTNLRVRRIRSGSSQDEVLPLPESGSEWLDGSIHIEFDSLTPGSRTDAESRMSSFEEEDAAMDDEVDLEILLEVGAIQHDERVINTLFINSFLGSSSSPSDVISFILRVIRNQLQKSIDTEKVTLILDLRRLSFEVWSVITRTVTDMLKHEIDVQLIKYPDEIKWSSWMEDATAILVSLVPYPLPSESQELLSRLLKVDPLSVITIIASRLPSHFAPADHIHLLRTLRQVISAYTPQERNQHIKRLLHRYTFPNAATEEQKNLAQYIQRYLVESLAGVAGFPLLQAYHAMEPSPSHSVSLLVRILKFQPHLKGHFPSPSSQLNSVVNLRTLSASDWYAATKVACALIQSELAKKRPPITAGELESSRSLMNAILVLLSSSNHSMPLEGLRALQKLLVTSIDGCLDFLPGKIHDHAMLDHIIPRLSKALHLSDNQQTLRTVSLLWSRHQRFKRSSITEVDNPVKTMLTSRLMDSLLRARVNDILPLFASETLHTYSYNSDTIQFIFRILNTILPVPYTGDDGETLPDLSTMDIESWHGLTSLAMKVVEHQANLFPISPYPPVIKDALVLILSPYKEVLSETCQFQLRRFLENNNRATAIIADISFPKSLNANSGRFPAFYHSLKPVLEIFPPETMLDCVGSIISKRFCLCENHHDRTLMGFLGAHAADIATDVFDTVAKHLMTVVDDSLRSSIPIISTAQAIASVLFSPHFTVAASGELVAIRRTWICDQLERPEATHILLHFVSTKGGFDRPQLTTIVNIILENLMTGGEFIHYMRLKALWRTEQFDRLARNYTKSIPCPR